MKSRLSLEKIEAAAGVIDPVFLNTPQFQSDALSHHLGMSMVLKIETVNPIRCFKGRGADFFLSCLPDRPSRLVCASAGNFGQGLAYAARKRGFQVVVFAAESASPMKVDRMRQLGAEVRLFGCDMGEAKEKAQAFAEQTQARFVEDGCEPEITEGAGTIAIELCRWIHLFDVLLVPVGDGALIRGIGRWMKTHSPVTRIVGVCAAGAPAMATSWRQGMPCSTESVSTIADGIAVRVPVPEALDDFNELVDDMVTVEDAHLIEAMQLVFSLSRPGHGTGRSGWPGSGTGVQGAFSGRESRNPTLRRQPDHSPNQELAFDHLMSPVPMTHVIQPPPAVS